MTAAIVSMAVKHALRIVENEPEKETDGTIYRLEPLGLAGKNLTHAEKAAYKEIFPSSESLELNGDEASDKRMKKARAALKTALREEHYGVSFLRNLGYTLVSAGSGIAAAALFLLLLSRDGTGGWEFFYLWMVSAVIAGFFVTVLMYFWRLFEDGQWFSVVALLLNTRLLILVLVVAFFLGFSAIQRQRQFTAGGEIELVVLLAGALFGLCVAIFHELMSAPTKAGRKLLDEIEGFALYLETLEEQRPSQPNQSEPTRQLFERLLPYAIALGLASEWSSKFSDALSKTAVPAWYFGSGGCVSAAFLSGFGNAIASTSAPTSSSGGGGFSGGGGGGGGGGSW